MFTPYYYWVTSRVRDVLLQSLANMYKLGTDARWKTEDTGSNCAAYFGRPLFQYMDLMLLSVVVFSPGLLGYFRFHIFTVGSLHSWPDDLEIVGLPKHCTVLLRI